MTLQSLVFGFHNTWNKNAKPYPRLDQLPRSDIDAAQFLLPWSLWPESIKRTRPRAPRRSDTKEQEDALLTSETLFVSQLSQGAVDHMLPTPVAVDTPPPHLEREGEGGLSDHTEQEDPPLGSEDQSEREGGASNINGEGTSNEGNASSGGAEEARLPEEGGGDNRNAAEGSPSADHSSTSGSQEHKRARIS